MLIECSFGRLKARFGALKRAMDINLMELPHFIYACFVLHNFCELSNERISEDKVSSAMDHDREFQPPQQHITIGLNAMRLKAKELGKSSLNILILNDTTS